VILLERFDGMFERAWCLWHVLHLLGREGVDVLGPADLPGLILFSTPSMPHQHGGKGQYGLVVGSGQRNSMRLALAEAATGTRMAAERLRDE